MPTSENPHIEPGELEAARLEMTEAAFNQEFLALFVNWEGSVFLHVGEGATLTVRTTPEAGHEYVIGCDWGRSNDCTVFLVLDVTAKAVVATDHSNFSGQHDDTVMALAMAWSAVSVQSSLIYPFPESTIVVPEIAIPDHWPRAYGLDIRRRIFCTSTASTWVKRIPLSMRPRYGAGRTGFQE
jgi:hypothetical protein